MSHRKHDSLKPYVPLTFALGVASLGCLLMIALRVLVTGSVRYAFLLWNLFLAWIPYLLSLAIRRVDAKAGDAAGVKPLVVLLGVAWLFFFPNAPYILTDFIHLIRGPVEGGPRFSLVTENALLWYDILLNSSFAFVGHFIGLISLLILHRLIGTRYHRRWGWAFAVVAIGMGGYGIYIRTFRAAEQLGHRARPAAHPPGRVAQPVQPQGGGVQPVLRAVHLSDLPGGPIAVPDRAAGRAAGSLIPSAVGLTPVAALPPPGPRPIPTGR